MPGPSRWRASALTHAVTANKVPLKKLDDRVRAVLRLIRAGIDSGIPENALETELNREKDRALLRRAAAESVVLLKNDDKVLPLKKSERIAVIGPNSKIATYCGGGSASLNPYEAITPYRTYTKPLSLNSSWHWLHHSRVFRNRSTNDGFTPYIEGVSQKASNIEFEQGIYGHQKLPLLGKLLRNENGEIGFTLKIFNDPPNAEHRRLIETRHETDSMLFFLDYNHPNLETIWYADAEGSFVPEESGTYDFGLCLQGTGRLYVNGELVVSNYENQRPGPSFLGSGTMEETASVELVKGQTYNILVQWGCAKTSKLKAPGTVDFGHGGFRISGCKRLDPAQGIADAVELAKNSDQVILFAGLSGEWESEGEDRETMDLPPHTDELIEAVLEANRNTVIVIQSGTPVLMPWIDKAKAVLHAWYGGNETGNGIADVIFGDVNPSGKLPMTFPRRLEDNPASLNYRSEGGRCLYGEDVYVGYRYFDQAKVEPLFPFGHGLSYTTFTISDLHLQQDGDNVLVSAMVENNGLLVGSATVQLYVASVTKLSPTVPRRPPQELKAFLKVSHLQPGEAREVQFVINPTRDTSYWDEKMGMWCSSAGVYHVILSQSSRDVAEQKLVMQIDETKWWSGLTP